MAVCLLVVGVTSVSRAQSRRDPTQPTSGHSDHTFSRAKSFSARISARYRRRHRCFSQAANGSLLCRLDPVDAGSGFQRQGPGTDIARRHGGCRRSRTAPILAINSGPSMAPIAGLRVTAAESEHHDAIVFDTGGTTFDVSLVRNGHVPFTHETWLGRPFQSDLTGFPRWM